MKKNSIKLASCKDKTFAKRLVCVVVLCIICLMGLGSCRSTQYVPVETVKIEEQYKGRRDSCVVREVVVICDSVRYRDSVVQVVDVGGNVVRTEVYKWRDRFRENNVLLERLQHKYDSLYKAKQDSVQVPFPVEKQLSRWESVKIEFGGWAFGGAVLMISLFIGWLAVRLLRLSRL